MNDAEMAVAARGRDDEAPAAAPVSTTVGADDLLSMAEKEAVMLRFLNWLTDPALDEAAAAWDDELRHSIGDRIGAGTGIGIGIGSAAAEAVATTGGGVARVGLENLLEAVRRQSKGDVIHQTVAHFYDHAARVVATLPSPLQGGLRGGERACGWSVG